MNAVHLLDHLIRHEGELFTGVHDACSDTAGNKADQKLRVDAVCEVHAADIEAFLGFQDSVLHLGSITQPIQVKRFLCAMIFTGGKGKESFALHRFLPGLEVIGNGIAAVLLLLGQDVLFAGFRDAWDAAGGSGLFSLSAFFSDLPDQPYRLNGVRCAVEVQVHERSFRVIAEQLFFFGDAPSSADARRYRTGPS